MEEKNKNLDKKRQKYREYENFSKTIDDNNRKKDYNRFINKIKITSKRKIEEQKKEDEKVNIKSIYKPEINIFNPRRGEIGQKKIKCQSKINIKLQKQDLNKDLSINKAEIGLFRKKINSNKNFFDLYSLNRKINNTPKINFINKLSLDESIGNNLFNYNYENAISYEKFNIPTINENTNIPFKIKEQDFLSINNNNRKNALNYVKSKKNLRIKKNNSVNFNRRDNSTNNLFEKNNFNILRNFYDFNNNRNERSAKAGIPNNPSNK